MCRVHAVIIRLTCTNVWESMESLAAARYFIKAVFLTTSHTRIHISTSHARICIRYYKSHALRASNEFPLKFLQHQSIHSESDVQLPPNSCSKVTQHQKLTIFISHAPIARSWPKSSIQYTPLHLTLPIGMPTLLCLWPKVN